MLTVAGLGLGLALTGCSAPKEAEGTYLGSSGYTALVLESGGKCGYTEEYDEASGVQVEVQDGCSWGRASLFGSKDLKFTGMVEGDSLTGFIGDDGSITIPDQGSWVGETFTKK